MKKSNEYNFNLEASSYIPKNQRGSNLQNENANYSYNQSGNYQNDNNFNQNNQNFQNYYNKPEEYVEYNNNYGNNYNNEQNIQNQMLSNNQNNGQNNQDFQKLTNFNNYYNNQEKNNQYDNYNKNYQDYNDKNKKNFPNKNEFKNQNSYYDNNKVDNNNNNIVNKNSNYENNSSQINTNYFSNRNQNNNYANSSQNNNYGNNIYNNNNTYQKTLEKPLNNTIEKPIQKTFEKPNEIKYEKTFEKPNKIKYEKTFEKPNEIKYEKSFVKPYGKTYEKSYEKPYEKSYEKLYGKTYEKPYEKTYEKPYEKTYEKPYEKTYEKPYEKTYEKSYVKSYEKPYQKTYEISYEKSYSNKNYEDSKPIQKKEDKIEVIQRIIDTKDTSQPKFLAKQLDKNSSSAYNQDLEDDYFDEETYGESHIDDNPDEEFDDEDYDFRNNKKYNYPDQDLIEEDLGISNNHSSKQNFKSKNAKSTYVQTSQNINDLSVKFTKNLNLNNNKTKYPSKTELIFDNKESFTDYVDCHLSQENRKNQDITDSFVNVLMIAEKPSIAKSLSEALSTGKYNSKQIGRGKTLITFDGYFFGAKAKFTVSSVMGHVYTSDFQKEHNNWNSIDAFDLYEVPIVKLDANEKTRIPSFLNSLANGKDILCLWLDCDKEGENICYEVINNTFKYMNKKNYQQIYRAKFSSLTKTDLKSAFNGLKERPNKYESLSVDVRQVIDLKIGVSFTRFLTSSILPGLKDMDTKLLSYGPCQTPTLWFCVNRQREIFSFIPKEYFRIYTDIEVKKIKYKIFYKQNFHDRKVMNDFLLKFKDTKKAIVKDVIVSIKQKAPPAGMNTVQMLRIASSYLKISPHQTMVVAEKLYTMGYVTYPRTETTKYAASFDFKKAISDFSSHSVFGMKVNTHILKNYTRPILKGTDVGDHPPITPSKVADQSELKGDYWRLYELICTNFFASLSPPAEYEERSMTIDIEGEIFTAESMTIVKDGFLAFMPWKRGNYIKDFPALNKDTSINISTVSYEARWTEALPYLSESDLIKLMEKNKIGTDASMPVHIENICNRGYVTVDEGRKLIPTNLGKALIESLSIVDPELVQPTIRAEIETLVDSVAKGKKTFSEILRYTVNLYKNKFLMVRQNYEKMIVQFRRYFNVDTAGITNISKNIKKQNTEYRSQIQVKKTEKEISDNILNNCTDCKTGKMYVDYDAFDKFILVCTKKLIRDAVKIQVIQDKCAHCFTNICDVEIQYPLITGEKNLIGCMFCEKNLNYGLN